MKSYQKPNTILWETSARKKIECHGKKNNQSDVTYSKHFIYY